VQRGGEFFSDLKLRLVCASLIPADARTATSLVNTDHHSELILWNSGRFSGSA
jgi:hypothetical protein